MPESVKKGQGKMHMFLNVRELKKQQIRQEKKKKTMMI